MDNSPLPGNRLSMICQGWGCPSITFQNSGPSICMYFLSPLTILPPTGMCVCFHMYKVALLTNFISEKKNLSIKFLLSFPLTQYIFHDAWFLLLFSLVFLLPFRAQPQLGSPFAFPYNKNEHISSPFGDT